MRNGRDIKQTRVGDVEYLNAPITPLGGNAASSLKIAVLDIRLMGVCKYPDNFARFHPNGRFLLNQPYCNIVVDSSKYVFVPAKDSVFDK